MPNRLELNRNYKIQLEDGSYHHVRTVKINESTVTFLFIMEWIACVKTISYQCFKII